MKIMGGAPIIFIDNNEAHCLNQQKYAITKLWPSIKKHSAIIQTNGVVTEVPQEDILFVLLRINKSRYLVVSGYSIEKITREGHIFRYHLSNIAVDMLNNTNIPSVIEKKGPKEVWTYAQMLPLIRLTQTKAVNLLMMRIDNWDGQSKFVRDRLLEKSMVHTLCLILCFQLDDLAQYLTGFLMLGELEFLVCLTKTLIKRHPKHPACKHMQLFVSTYDDLVQELREAPAHKPRRKQLEALLQRCTKRYTKILRNMMQLETVMGQPVNAIAQWVEVPQLEGLEDEVPMQQWVVQVPENIRDEVPEKLQSIKSAHKARKCNHNARLWTPERLTEKMAQYHVVHASPQQMEELLRQDKEFMHFVAVASTHVRQEYRQLQAQTGSTPLLLNQVDVDICLMIALRRTELWVGKRVLKKGQALIRQWREISSGQQDVEQVYGCSVQVLRDWVAQLADMEQGLLKEVPFIYMEGGGCRVTQHGKEPYGGPRYEACRERLRRKAKWRYALLPEACIRWLCELEYLLQQGESVNQTIDGDDHAGDD